MNPDRRQNRPAPRSMPTGKVHFKDVVLPLTQTSPDPSPKKKCLSLAESHVLVERAKSGDAKAWQQLRIYYAGMLQYTVLKMEVRDANHKEAIAEGLIALQIAVAKYPTGDPEHFTEYARRWVQRRVRRYARSLRRSTVDE